MVVLDHHPYDGTGPHPVYKLVWRDDVLPHHTLDFRDPGDQKTLHRLAELGYDDNFVVGPYALYAKPLTEVYHGYYQVAQGDSTQKTRVLRVILLLKVGTLNHLHNLGNVHTKIAGLGRVINRRRLIYIKLEYLKLICPRLKEYLRLNLLYYIHSVSSAPLRNFILLPLRIYIKP
ncbi:hypothetical protein MBAV_005314 [Candidatus Magnetobacterium bavaricum]|uniref:Uncharacterized protein n=1 Tax=Candidatus Magnetobacterium bavaricum TaxID=29290 RepID=A0A0F3GKY6_9BACT|nr:hypothetical protein MBAV_005314 [Candidatus Magnetobacterium bavaricum]